MTKLFVSTVALATLIAAPALAASKARHVQRDAPAYAVANPGSNVVVFGNRVIGQDVDPSIRTQLIHDPLPSEY